MALFSLLFELRRRGVRVGLNEAMALARALSLGLADSSLEGFYRVARALCVHREADLDAFDEAFGVCFRGQSPASEALAPDLDAWLRDPRERPELTPDELAALERLDEAQLRRLFEERMRTQRERHDRGNHWIGTGGTSPFGNHGAHPTGLRLGASSGGHGSVGTADARAYRPYRSDLVLDVRQMAVALRKLRVLAREGSRLELDLDATIARTAQNAGELEVVMRAPKRAGVRVLLLMDVGGSMDPHAELVGQLFSAAKRASNFRELKTFYFHNCVYSRLYGTESMREPIGVEEVLRRCTREWKLVVVGDAAMHPAELFGEEWLPVTGQTPKTGLEWSRLLADHFDRSAWLNPDPPRHWRGGTAAVLAETFAMFPLTLDGLGEAMAHLRQTSRPARPATAHKRTSM